MTATSPTKTNSNKLTIVIALCATLVLLASVGGWVYVQKQQVAQKDRELQQQKQLKEYEQEQLNKRNEQNNATERLKSSGVNYAF